MAGLAGSIIGPAKEPEHQGLVQLCAPWALWQYYLAFSDLHGDCALFSAGIYPIWRHCCSWGRPDGSKDVTNQLAPRLVTGGEFPTEVSITGCGPVEHDPVVFQPIGVTLTFISTHHSHWYDHHCQWGPNSQFNDVVCLIIRPQGDVNIELVLP